MTRKALHPIEAQVLAGYGVPEDTADMYLDPDAGQLRFIPSDMRGSQFSGRVTWSTDALVDILVGSDEEYVSFSHFSDKFWLCRWTRIGDSVKETVSKMALSKVQAAYEVLLQLLKDGFIDYTK